MSRKQRGEGGIMPDSYHDAFADITTKVNWLDPKQGFTFNVLVDEIERMTSLAKSKIAQIRSKRSAMSIADMFDLQMAMNKLTQFSEMSTSVIAAMNSSISSLNRNIKG